MKKLKKDRLFFEIREFFLKNLDLQRPLLLAFSGGVDSSTLLNLLLEFRKEEKNFDIHLAHVDHNLRKNSTQEALLLQDFAKKNELTFHLKTLPKFLMKNNLEDRFRDLRYEFFFWLMKKWNFQALLLAHHADDLAETVLKRVLEGSHLVHLRTLERVSYRENVKILRPLLDFTKNEIRSYAKEKKLFFIEDETNHTSEFLRGRMRKEILPYLKEKFGKEVCQNLVVLSQRAAELNSYLDQKILSFEKMLKEGPLGFYLDVRLLSSLDPFEIKHLIIKVLKKNGSGFSRKMIEVSLELILKKKLGTLMTAKGGIYLHYPYLFFTKDLSKFSFDPSVLKEGIQRIGPLEILVKKVDSSERIATSWFDLWEEGSSILVPYKEFQLTVSKKGERGYQFFKKRWSQNSVPFFLRSLIPLIKDREGNFYNFLIPNKTKLNNKDNCIFIKIAINKQ